MTLGRFEQWIIENKPRDTWPSEILATYLTENVPEEEWPAYLEKRVIPQALNGWSPRELLQAVSGEPVAIVTPSARREKTRRDATNRIRRNRHIEQERLRLLRMWESRSTDSSEILELQANIWKAATVFAQKLRLDRVASRDVVMYLTAPILGRTNDDFVASGSSPAMYVNLAQNFVLYPMPPGCIVLDVTNSAHADLDTETRRAIVETQDRLNHSRPVHGAPIRNEECYLRAKYLRDFNSLSWDQIMSILDEEFPRPDGEPRDQKNFQNQFYRWHKSTSKRRRAPA